MSNQILDDADLAFTRTARRKIVDELLTGKLEEKDPKILNVVLSALDGIDRTHLSLRRMDVDKGIADKNAEVASTIAAIYNDPSLQAIVNANNANSKKVAVIPELPDDLPEPTVVKGELDTLTSTVRYNEFAANS